MSHVNNATPLSTGLREHRKGEEFINRAPQLQQETPADLLPSSITEISFQPTGQVVRDEGAGIRLAQTNYRGYFIELLPPVYSS